MEKLLSIFYLLILSIYAKLADGGPRVAVIGAGKKKLQLLLLNVHYQGLEVPRLHISFPKMFLMLI